MRDGWLDTILSLLDRLAPEPRTASREARRRGRSIVATTLIGVVLLAGTAASTLWLGLDSRLVPWHLGAALVALALLPLARRLRSPGLLANGLLAVIFSHTVVLSALAGGRSVGALFALTVFPMLAVLLSGWRSALAFTALSAAAAVLTPRMPPALALFPSDAPPVGAALVRDALNVIVGVGLVAALYDAARSATLRDAEASRARAEVAADRQRRLVDLSRRLQEASGERFSEVLERAMEQTAQLAGANRTLLQLLPAAGFSGRFTWGEAPTGLDSDPPEVVDATEAQHAFRWAGRRLLEGQILQVRRLDELPPAAAEERAYLERRGVASWLCVPIRAAGHTIAFQSFETTRVDKVWDDDEVAALRLMSELVASAVLRHRTEHALGESEQKFALAFHDHPDAMIIVDLETQAIVECNERWLREVGRRDRRDVLGRRPWDLGIDLTRDEREALRARLRADGRLPGVEIRVIGPGGEPRVYLVSATRIELGGRPCALANVHDLTERDHLEQQLLHAQKMEAVGRLAGGIAHDYNNMLTVITGYSAGLIEQLEGDLRKDAEEIHAAARRSADLTRQLLAFSRRQVLRTESLDPNRLLSNLEGLLRPLIGESITLRLDLCAEPARVSSDRGQLEQAVVNLVVNARDAMPDGGTLTLATRRVTLPDPGHAPAHPPDLEPGDYSLIVVSDEGQGIDPDVIEHVMEPFYTTKPEGEGTGLGLPMVHGLARQCGGTLRVESEPGCGTQATIYLPALDDTPTVGLAHPHERAVGTATAPRRILLVEDEERVSRLAARTLRAAGYEVETVDDGERARERVAALGDDLDLVVSDVVMPRLSGLALVRDLRTARPDLPVVLMSGYPDSSGGSPIPENVSFLMKPFQPSELREAVERAFAVRRG